LMEVTNFNTGLSERKPAVWIDGNTHAGEVMGSMISLKIITYLLENYGKDRKLTNLLDEITFYILPRIDVDGGEFVLTTPHYVLGRDNETGGGRWYPLTEKEWKANEHGLYLEDVNGDGVIVSMRIKDEAGEWKISENDNRIMVLRNPEDVEGAFYRVYPEGLILNYDGEREIEMAPPRWSLNFNRNYPGEWAKEDASRGSGPYPLSEPETKSVVNFIVSHPNIGMAITYHTHGGVLFSFSEDEQLPEHDRKLFKMIESLFQSITGYPTVSMKRRGPGGSFSTYMSIFRAVPCFTVEAWDLAGEIGMGNWITRGGFNASGKYDIEQQALKLMEWNEKKLNGEGFIEWKEFFHPQLGKVEIGGWKKKFLWRNPPVKFMEAEIDKNMFFPIKCAKLLPRITITHASAEKLDDSIYKIKTTIENKGALPTYIMKQAIDIKSVKPVEVKINLGKGMKLLEGYKIKKMHLEGYVHKILDEKRSERDKTKDKNKITLKWIIETKKESRLKITVFSQKAGSDSVEIKIPS